MHKHFGNLNYLIARLLFSQNQAMEGIRKPSTTVTKVMDPALSTSLTLLQLQKKSQLCQR